MDAQDRTGLFGTQRFEASTRASRGLSTARPFLQNFVRQDVHRLRVGVEPPVEPEAFAPLVLAPQRDLERPIIFFIEERGDNSSNLPLRPARASMTRTRTRSAIK